MLYRDGKHDDTRALQEMLDAPGIELPLLLNNAEISELITHDVQA